jgi:hypothetical protein
MAMTMKIPSRELWSYFGYGLGQCFSFGLVGSFINYFYTDVLGISALAASTIFLIARAWDAVHDPLFASIMDTINSRFGKFRHFLLIAPLLITGVTLLSFYKISGHDHQNPLAGVTYILWGRCTPSPISVLVDVVGDDQRLRAAHPRGDGGDARGERRDCLRQHLLPEAGGVLRPVQQRQRLLYGGAGDDAGGPAADA